MSKDLREKGELGKIAFGDPDNDPGIAKLQKAKPGSERNTDYEDGLYRDIEDWVNSNDDFSRDRGKDLLAFKKEYPAVFNPRSPEGTILYRGISDISYKTENYLRKNTTKKNWHEMKENYFWCDYPITYQPRKRHQSWTTNINVAKDFGSDGILITKQDSNFVFNHKVLDYIYGTEEFEVIHVGEKYKNRVYIAVEEDFYLETVNRWFKKGKGISFKDIGKDYKL